MAPEAPKPRTTAYEDTERELGWLLEGTRIDHESFARPIERCDLRTCRGMCCYDGTWLSAMDAGIVEGIAKEEGAFLREIGLDLPEEPILRREEPDGSVVCRTALKLSDLRAKVEGYPAEFRDTTCVFHLDDGRCGLQVLSEARGHHPWHFKPLLCWLHPVAIEERAVFLPDERADGTRSGGNAAFVTRTFCGRTEPAGRPAGFVLAEEIGTLRAIDGTLE